MSLPVLRLNCLRTTHLKMEAAHAAVQPCSHRCIRSWAGVRLRTRRRSISGASEQDAETRIVTILSDGVKGIKKRAIAAYDESAATAGNAPQAASDDDD